MCGELAGLNLEIDGLVPNLVPSRIPGSSPVATSRNNLYSNHVQIIMATETTYTRARANLKALLDEASDSRQPVIIHRRGGDDVALIAVDELRSLIETAHLLRSPKNAERLLRALGRAQSGKVRAQSLEKLRRDIGLDE
jgi:antitoxin YefM